MSELGIWVREEELTKIEASFYEFYIQAASIPISFSSSTIFFLA